MTVHIAVVMMLKNEEQRVGVSLDSISTIASSLIIYDTGSTDSTVSIVKTFCNLHNIPLRIIHGDFVDFSTSRNVLLDYADTFNDIDYLLLLDCNDELRNPDELKEFACKNIHSPETCWFISQQWWSGECIKYYNSRFFRPRCGWRYKGVVHEYLYSSNEQCEHKIPDDIYLYQDRTLDDDKTKNRFSRDEQLLLEDYNNNPNDERTVFYLAQTYLCLHNEQEAYRFYQIRAEMNGFAEENFEAILQCGKISEKYAKQRERVEHELSLISPKTDEENKRVEFLQEEMKRYDTEWFSELTWDTSLVWYSKAFVMYKRIEPLVQMGKYYKDRNEFELSFMYLNLACILSVPDDSRLFVDQHCYDYVRWHELGIVSFYVKQYQIGYDACIHAIDVLNREIDRHNLEFYKKQL